MNNHTAVLSADHLKGDVNEPVFKRCLRRWPALVRPVKVVLDLSALLFAFGIAYLLRYDLVLSDLDTGQTIAVELPVLVAVQFWALRWGGGLRFVWRYFSLTEAKVFAVCALSSLALLLLVRATAKLFLDCWLPPVSLLVSDSVLAFASLLGMRAVCRSLNESGSKRSDGKAPEPRKRILLIGAGRIGMIVAHELRIRARTRYEVLGFIDDDVLKQDSIVQGIRVLGTLKDLPSLVRQLGIDHVVITMAAPFGQDLFRILKVCDGIPVKARIIPSVDEMLMGKFEVGHIRDVNIQDLLPREPVHFNEQGVKKFLNGKRVMITGAGGSIGSELVRQVARYEPSELLLVERTEFALFNIDREMRESQSAVSCLPLIADVGDSVRMSSIFRAHRPQVVIHAAAHKHVPMMECNPTEAIKNNILATRCLGTLAAEFGVEAFVLISTDKAVRPSSVMGASKRVAELVVQELNTRYLTRFITVRFGNVLGSTGSVIPIFLEQIRKGGPVTVTHPDMMRYFMTIPEAAHLVLEACALGNGGEIFILDMGEPVRILDVAERLIDLAGLRRRTDIDIVFTGMRPGEKLVEETAQSEEHLQKTTHPKIFVGEIAGYPQQVLQKALERLDALAKAGDESGLRMWLGKVIPEARLHIGPPSGGQFSASTADVKSAAKGELLEKVAVN